MKTTELVKKYALQFLRWNHNEETGVFWVNLETLEESGMLDPWARPFTFEELKPKFNRDQDITHYELLVDVQGYPVQLVVLNE